MSKAKKQVFCLDCRRPAVFGEVKGRREEKPKGGRRFKEERKGGRRWRRDNSLRFFRDHENSQDWPWVFSDLASWSDGDITRLEEVVQRP